MNIIDYCDAEKAIKSYQSNPSMKWPLSKIALRNSSKGKLWKSRQYVEDLENF